MKLRETPLTREEKTKATQLLKELGLLPQKQGSVAFITMMVNAELVVNSIKLDSATLR